MEDARRNAVTPPAGSRIDGFGNLMTGIAGVGCGYVNNPGRTLCQRATRLGGHVDQTDGKGPSGLFQLVLKLQNIRLDQVDDMRFSFALHDQPLPGMA